MKAFAFILLVAGSLVVTGCESDMPPEPAQDNPLQRGIRGEGTIQPRDFSDDPYIRQDSSSSY